MTIVAVWEEDGHGWMAADTRFANDSGTITSDSGAKLYSLPIRCHRPGGDGSLRVAHWWSSYGFAFAGAVLPASMTAVTASTLLQQLVGPANTQLPPRFEEIAEFVRSIASKFAREHYDAHQREGALFSAGMLGWCPYDEKFKVAHISPFDGGGGTFDMKVTFPAAPQSGEAWLLLGSEGAKLSFDLEYQQVAHSRARRPILAIENMIAKNGSLVGGALSLAVCQPSSPAGVTLLYRLLPQVPGAPAARRVFNGIDLDKELSQVGNYQVGVIGLA